jgi:exopolysaccharide production negative regulator
MQISDVLARIALIAVGFGLSAPALAFDGAHTPEQATVTIPAAPTPTTLGGATALPNVPVPTPGAAAVPHQPLTPFEAFRSGARALRAGKTHQAVTALEYAAEQGVAAAQWKLGRMYADGDGVNKDKLRAFKYFSRIANEHATDNPDAPQARFVANAFVALGNFYLTGIPNSSVVANPAQARRMFDYAASYFRDADAQYYLGRLYLKGIGAPKDARHAARWLRLAANKGHCRAQALLGSLLFTGDKSVARQAARGLMWLTLSKDCASGSEAWITEKYDSAMKRANDDERAMAGMYLEHWMRNQHE